MRVLRIRDKGPLSVEGAVAGVKGVVFKGVVAGVKGAVAGSREW